MARRKRKPSSSSSSESSGKKVGRPKKRFTKEQRALIEEMAFNQCHVKTIADVIGCDNETITAHFSQILKLKRAEGRAALHQKQVQAALSGENTMLVWLGKNVLDQTDRQQIEHNANIKLYDKAAPTEEV